MNSKGFQMQDSSIEQKLAQIEQRLAIIEQKLQIDTASKVPIPR